MSNDRFGSGKGGYAGSFDDERFASDNDRQNNRIGAFVSGTISMLFIIFAVFIIISVMTSLLMYYVRRSTRKEPKPGFYNIPPPAHYRPSPGQTNKNQEVDL